MKTSFSDNETYPSFCARAAEDDRVFSEFKQSAIYTEILEHVEGDLGAQYLDYVLRHYPELQAHFDRFRENDLLGSPRVFQFDEHGVFSPTTLRYIKIAGDLKSFFGDLTGMRVVEIGAGYGGQCKILSDLFRFDSYTILDLPPVRRLAKKYLDKLGVPNVRFDVDESERCDLVISNYAFSELSRSVQDMYLAKVVLNARHGYMILNEFNFGGAYSTQEIAGMIAESSLIDEVPLTSPKNKTLIWSP